MLLTVTQKTIKELLPAILSSKKCSAKEIQEELISMHDKKVSLQAIYKILEDLISKNVVVKNNRVYGLHKEWINYIEGISKKAKLHEEKKEFINPKDVKVKTLIFKNLVEMDDYCSELHNHHYSNSREVCLVYRHHWWHLLYPGREYDNKKGNKKYYCVCTKNSLLDLQGSKFKKKLGMNVVHKNVPLHGELEIHKEFVVEKFIPNEINKLLDNFFSKTKSVVDLNIKELMDILKKDCEIIVVINKDINLAKDLRAYFKKMFRC